METASLRVSYEPASSRFHLAAKPSFHEFAAGGLVIKAGARAGLTSIKDASFGAGEAIVLQHPDGETAEVMLFPGINFVLIRSRLNNRTGEPIILHSRPTCSFSLNLGVPAQAIKTLGTGGLRAPNECPGSYMWLATVEPESRRGVVSGWLTSIRGSGIVHSRIEGPSVLLEAKLDYGNLELKPGETANLETFAIGYFDDARLGLEAWAEAVAQRANIQLPPQPVGYCTWYSRPHGGASDEKSLAQLAAFSATNLAPFGFSLVQIDDGWQAGFKRKDPSSPKKNFTTHDPQGPYPSGMKAAAGQIEKLGLTPGIWYMPFAGTLGDPFFDAHPEWFAKNREGRPFDTPWGGACLDLTHPGAREYVTEITRRICRDWGYRYIKIDGLWTGTATRQKYVNDAYADDQMGEAVFHAGPRPNVEVYREGLKLLRQAAGTNVFVLGCCAPQNMRSYGGAFGLVDAMRVGPDNGTSWKGLVRGPLFGSRQYFLNRRVWYNDPDPLYVREEVPLRQAQLICSWVTLSGQMNLCSEWLPALPAERLDLLKRSMPYHNGTARPVDLFVQEPARIWRVSKDQNGAPRELVGFFNWDEDEKTIACSLAQLGLDSRRKYVGFDFWGNRLLPASAERLEATVPGHACVVLAVRPEASHPQLLSTSRHITQGMVDVLEETWNEMEKTLSGRSLVVGEDVYELRIPTDRKVLQCAVSAEDIKAGVKTFLATEPGLVRAQIEAPASREVAWKVLFK